MTAARAMGADVASADGSELAEVYADIGAYYSAKVVKFGATPLGVDWTCQPTQELRFVQLLKLCDFNSAFSLNDLGCGYGALVAYLNRRHPDFAHDYLGVDLSDAMLRRARRLWRGRDNVRFARGHNSPRQADYSVASGIFNVQLDQPTDRWEKFVARTLEDLNRTSKRGFSVNFVKAPSNGAPGREGVYSTEPERWATYCAAQFRATTEVIEDYGLREFTLIIRNSTPLPP